MAAAMIEVMPRLGNVKVVRQWAGPYDMNAIEWAVRDGVRVSIAWRSIGFAPFRFAPF